MPELDIHASAREVADLLNCNRTADAVERLDALRAGQSLAVREALDRYVAVEAKEQLAAMTAQLLLRGAVAAEGHAFQIGDPVGADVRLVLLDQGADTARVVVGGHQIPNMVFSL